MAYYDDKDELQQGQNADPNAIPAGQQTGPQSGVISGQDSGTTAGAAASGAAATATAPTPDRSGNFVGLQDYLKANRPQSSKLGDQVAGQVQSSINTAQDEIGSLSSRFNQQADAGQIANINNATNEAKGIVSQASTADKDNQITEDQTNRFGEIANAQYKGPSTLEETQLYDPAYQAMLKAQNYSDLSKNEAGSQQLLNDIYKSPDYSAGENLFDSYLLNSQENRDKLAGARTAATSGLQEQLASASQGAAQYAAQQKALADSVRQGAQATANQAQIDRNAAIQAALNKIAYGDDGIQGTADDATTGWQSEYNQYLNLLQNSNEGKNLDLTAEQAAKLGVGEGQRIYNLLAKSAGNTPQQYLELQAFDPNRVISKNEQAQLANLDKLAATYGGELKNPFTGEDLAGTLSKATAFAADQFGASAKEAEQAFQLAAKIVMTSEASKGATIMDEKDVLVGREIAEKIVENLPWPLSDIVRWVTRTVYDLSRIKYSVGSVDTKGKTSGSVADYLAGSAGNYKNEGGTKSLDWGTILSPEYLIQSRADDKINELQRAIEAETRANWTSQIENYLKNAGYYNTIK